MTIPNIGIPVSNGGPFIGVTSRGRGSGRTAQWEFPDALQMYSTAVPVTANQMRNRLNNSTLACSVGGFGGGGANLATQGPASATATPVVVFAGNNAGLGQLWRPTPTGNGPIVWLQIDKSKTGVPAGFEDYGVSFVSCTAAYIGVTGSNTLDAGFQCTTSGSPFITGPGVGFAFLRTAPNTVQLGVRVNGGAGIQFYPLVSPTIFNEAIQHRYSLLFVSATATSEAFVTAYVDMVPYKTLQWGAGKTNVTAPVGDAVFLGYVPQIIYGLNGGYHVKCPAGVEVIHAPTVTDALF